MNPTQRRRWDGIDGQMAREIARFDARIIIHNLAYVSGLGQMRVAYICRLHEFY